MKALFVLLITLLLAGSARAGGDPVGIAIEQTFQPETRAQGILALERLVATVDDSRPVLHALARALAWEGRLEEALAIYDRLLPEARPGERSALEHERLEILSWQGRLDEVEAGYRQLVAGDPSDARARAGLGKIRRWRGRPLEALGLLERAVMLGPGQAEPRAELAATYLDLGMPCAARGALAGAAAPPELADRLGRHRHPTIALAATGSSDSYGVTRVAPRVTAELPLPGDLRLMAGGGLSRYEQDGAALEYRIGAGSLSLQRPHYQLGIGGAVYQGDDLLLGEGHVWLRARPDDGIELAVEARRRPLLEAVSPLVTGEQAFFGAGASGVTDLDAIARRGVDEVRAGLQLVGGPGYVYGDARALRLSDGNRGYGVATGAGIDLVPLLDGGGPLGLTLRLDSYLAGYAESRAEYFSPARFDGHVAGGQLRISPVDALTLTADGGLAVSIDQVSSGWTAGGGIVWRTENWHLGARAERRDDIYYQVSRAWLVISGRL